MHEQGTDDMRSVLLSANYFIIIIVQSQHHVWMAVSECMYSRQTERMISIRVCIAHCLHVGCWSCSV